MTGHSEVTANDPPNLRPSSKPTTAADPCAAAGRSAAQGMHPRRGLAGPEQWAAIAVGVLVAALGLIGAVNSFDRVASAVAPSFGGLAWSVPLGIDLGIAAFTALDLVLARHDIRLRWLPLIPWALVAATIYLNVAGEDSIVGAVAHAVLPCLWVVAVEVAGHVLRSVSGLVDGRAARRRLERIRWTRWLLAPLSTVRLWRRMVLWETPSYPVALVRERDRVLARTQLEDQYGRIAWRWRAPRLQRALYRLGELVPDQTGEASNGTAASGRNRPVGASPSRRRTKTTKTGPARRKNATVEDLLPIGRRIAARSTADGTALTRRVLADQLRSEAGVAVGNERVGQLLARLRDEAGDPPANARTNGGRLVAPNGQEL